MFTTQRTSSRSAILPFHDVSLTSAKRALATALLAGLATACLAWGAPAPAHAAEGTCSTLDQNGKPLQQPNISYGCTQWEALRQDCDKVETNGYRQLFNHCFAFAPGDIATGSIPRNAETQSKSSGGGSH